MTEGNAWLGFLPLLLILFFFIPALIGWIRIFSRVGWPAWLGVLLFVPVVNLVVFLLFAFKEWPIEQRLRSVAQVGTSVN